MKLIERKNYVKKLINVMNTPDIKVITGVRRCGKSKLLEYFIHYITKNIKKVNIIHINFNMVQFDKYQEYHALHDFVESSYKKGWNNFVFIDEVQMCPKFELAVNSLHASEKYDIYITGSNAFLLSSDLATLFTGRTFAINVFPFSFSEFMRYFELEDQYASFDRYIQEGGMAGSYVYSKQEEKYNYLRDVFETLIVRDIRQKYRIRHTAILDKIAEYMMDNISNQISVKNITDTLVNSNEKITQNTVATYMEYLCKAFAFYKIRRYDICGKKYLNSNDKYYLSDHAFRYAKLGTRNMDYGRILENIIAIDLVRRGYEVYTGVLYKKEIDFVAMRRNEKMYIQVSENISDDKTFMREAGSLLDIRDAYPKIILARTRHPRCQYEGIQIIDIADWLCQDNVYPMR